MFSYLSKVFFFQVSFNLILSMVKITQSTVTEPVYQLRRRGLERGGRKYIVSSTDLRLVIVGAALT